MCFCPHFFRYFIVEFFRKLDAFGTEEIAKQAAEKGQTGSDSSREAETRRAPTAAAAAE